MYDKVKLSTTTNTVGDIRNVRYRQSNNI